MQSKRISILIILLFTLLYQQDLLSQTIDSQGSFVQFTIRAMKMKDVKGKISGFSGTILWDTLNLKKSKIDVCIDARTLNTGNDKRDAHVKSADFMDVKQYPKICFKSDSIVRNNNFIFAMGKLTLHGITRSVFVPLKYKDAALEGKMVVNRLDYNVGKDIGTFKADEIVVIKIHCVLK